MANKDDRKTASTSDGRPSPELASLVDLLPALYYFVNRVLEDAMPQVSKKAGIILLILDSATTADEIGPYLSSGEIVEKFRAWSVVSPASANSEVSKAKAGLFDLNYVMVAGGRDHIHLTETGKVAARQMRERIAQAMGERLSEVGRGNLKRLVELIGGMLREDLAGVESEKGRGVS